MSGKTDTRKNLRAGNGASAANGGATGHVDESGDRWLPAALASRVCGLPKRTIARFAEQGMVERKADVDGTWLYSLDDLEPLAKEDSGKAEIERVKNSALKDAQEHARESFALVHGPSKDLLQLYKEEVATLRARVVQLEAGFDANIQAREALLSEAHARQLAERDAERRGQRWDQALATLQRVVPPLAAQAMASLGGRSDAPILMLLSRLDLGRLPTLLNVDAMNDDERAVMGELMSAIATQQEENIKAAATVPAAEGTGASDGN